MKYFKIALLLIYYILRSEIYIETNILLILVIENFSII